MENLRLGICDDETQDLAQILEMVKRYDEDCQLQITTFLHARDLLHTATTSGFDIAILDIDADYIRAGASQPRCLDRKSVV